VSYRPSILLFGDSSPPEFAAACQWLRTHGDVVEARRIDEDCLTRRVIAGWHPELVVGLQNRPGQWREEELDGASRLWPLAVTVALLGSWCEGEPRTGRPLPGVARVPWHQREAAFSLFWQAEPAESPGSRQHPGFNRESAASTRPGSIRSRQPPIGSRRTALSRSTQPSPPGSIR
jgi:hypothetical protein